VTVPVSDRAAHVNALLRARRQTIAVAESLTAGLLCDALAEPPGASVTFRGGLIVYATDLKSSLAGVPQELLDERGPVDGDVAAALAAGVRDRCSADWGLATTGVAGPDPQGGQPPGTVWLGLAGPNGSRSEKLELAGTRTEIRRAAVEHALEYFAVALAG
jgi:nicotinamide-nucleotide amidase